MYMIDMILGQFCVNKVCCWTDNSFAPFPVIWSAACADDEKRPWVRQEKMQFQAFLERNDVVVVEHKYFVEGEPTLLMHFEAIEAMQRGA